MGPLRPAFDREEFNQNNEGHFAPKIDYDKLREKLLEGVRKLGCFDEIVFVGNGAENPDRDTLLTQAWDQRCDLLLDLNLNRYEVYYVGSNWLYIPNLLYWAFFWALSGFTADEVYGGGIDVTADLYSVHSNRKIESWQLKKDVQRDLDDFERGWMLLGFLRMPGGLDEENWVQVDEVVGPYTLLEAGLGMVETLDQVRPKVGTPEFSEKMSKRMAVVVGIDRWKDYGFKRVKFASRDAKEFAKTLTGKMNVPEKNLRLLVDEQATRDNVKKEIRGFLASRATQDDTVFVYYAGYGYTSKAKKESGGYKGPGRYLMAFDSQFDKPEKTGIPLSELRSWLLEIKARNVVLVLDAGFNGPEDMRSLTGREGGKVPMPADAFKDLAGPGRLVLCAGGPNQGAQTFRPKSHGMFTYFLLSGLGEKCPADADKNGAVTVEEAYGFAKTKVSGQTQLGSHPQVPVLLGKPQGDLVFSTWEPAVEAPPKKAAPKKASPKKAPPKKGPEKKGGEKKAPVKTPAKEKK